MFNECRHLKTNGRKCHSPALSGKAYCYHHYKLHRMGGKSREIRVPITSIEDPRSIQLAVNQVLAGFKSPWVDTRRAGVFLYGLSLAAKVAKDISPRAPGKAVRTLSDRSRSESETGARAPKKAACELSNDCRN